MTALVFNLFADTAVAQKLAQAIGGELGRLELRPFPDGETYVRIHSPAAGRDVVLLCALDRPDDKIIPLCLTASAARDAGARRVILVVPYLPYMRQDQRFHPGEAISARAFTRLLDTTVDALITIDPHLHRIADLRTLFSIPTHTLHAAPALAQWIQAQVAHPLVVGPDGESEQWTAEVAHLLAAPYTVAMKQRHSDRKVTVRFNASTNDIGHWRDRTPVIVDDMITTAHTMIETVKILLAMEFTAPWCVAVHGLFVDDAAEALRAAGATRIATCNTVAHPLAQIDIEPLLASGVRAALQ